MSLVSRLKIDETDKIDRKRCGLELAMNIEFLKLIDLVNTVSFILQRSRHTCGVR